MGHYNFGGSVGALSWCGSSSSVVRHYVIMCAAQCCAPPYSGTGAGMAGHSPGSKATLTLAARPRNSHAAPETQLLQPCSYTIPTQPHPQKMAFLELQSQTLSTILATLTLVARPRNLHAAQKSGACSPAATPLPLEPPKVVSHHRSGFPRAANKNRFGPLLPSQHGLAFACSNQLPTSSSCSPAATALH